MERIMRWVVLALVGAALAACAAGGPSGPPPSQSYFVFFAVDGAELRPEAIEVIDRVAAEVRRGAATGVRIIGYASPAGAPAHNLRLSEQRAAAVEAALLARGVARDLLVRTSRGATEVIGPEIEGQRVEVVVVRAGR